ACGGDGSLLYDDHQHRPAELIGGPGVGPPVVVGTPIGDIFVITSKVIAGAGRLITFRGIESVEVDGAGGDDQFYVLSTSSDFILRIVGGSGDDVIHLGGDAPPILLDPPPFTYQPPQISVNLPPTLEINTDGLF